MNAVARRPMAPVKLSTTRLGAPAARAERGAGRPRSHHARRCRCRAARCGSAVNYEVPITGGYGRIAGYERYDGQDAPSDASYVIVQVSAFANVPSVGDAISQAGSGATGTVASVNNVTGATYMVVTQVVGTFNDTGVVSKAGPTVIGTAIAQTVATTAQQQAQYTAAAGDIYRALIGAVPGSGRSWVWSAPRSIRSIIVYAFRNNAGGTAVDLYSSTRRRAGCRSCSSTPWLSRPAVVVSPMTAKP